MEEYNIKFSKDKIEVVYTNPGAGCMVSSALFGTLLSAFILFIVAPDSGIVRGFLIGIIGIIGLIFSGSILLKLIGVLLSGKTLFTIESGLLKGRSDIVPINEIKDIKWGGASLKYLVVQTVHKRTVKLPTYNLVSEDKIHKVIGEYVIPYGSHELKENWEERYENKNI